MIKKTIQVLLVFISTFSFQSHAQTNLYAVDSIQIIQLTFTEPNWDYMMDTAKAGADGYTLAAQCIINGVVFDSVGVRYKGNSTYDSTRVKNPFHIKLDYVHGGASYSGYADIKLANGWSDPSDIREVLAYDILRNYMDEPQSNFVKLYVNGIYYGVYSSTQNLDADFLDQHFCSSNSDFIKANPLNVTNGHIPNLVYLGTDSTLYTDRYELKSNYGWNHLVGLCDTLANNPNALDTILDIDRTLWMLAFNDVTVNLDSYSGQFAQNYYLYRDHNHRFNPIIWDLNMCFGSFTNTGVSNLSLSLEQTLTPLLHQNNASRPLIKNILANSTWQKMYLAHVRTIRDEFFSNGNYLAIAQQLHDLIDTSVAAENYSIYAYNDFQNSFTTNVFTLPGLQQLMDARANYLDTVAVLQSTPPVINNITYTPLLVNFGGTVIINAKVTNADSSSVYLGYRYSRCDKFIHVRMYDDGAHNDGAAGDSMYAGTFPVSSLDVQYYLYAQNNAAGIFSPQRAEHEFYSLPVNISQATLNKVVINEVQADNTNTITNEDGNHKDWIELYNTTSSPLGLKNFYLSDDVNNLIKWKFPSNAYITGNGHLLIWADDKDTTLLNMHTNFNLQNSGDSVFLSTVSTLVPVMDDSVSFSFMGTDSSLERCPDGIGAWQFTSSPTPANTNCPTGIFVVDDASSFHVFPNPAQDEIHFTTDHISMSETISVFNLMGEKIVEQNFNSSLQINCSQWPSGIYFYNTSEGINGKFVVQQ